uniref:Uncharacterized protein n=1 Tax=Arundo donax TaxID=35708 RepID=A0A0A9BLA3_ARUDO
MPPAPLVGKAFFRPLCHSTATDQTTPCVP